MTFDLECDLTLILDGVTIMAGRRIGDRCRLSASVNTVAEIAPSYATITCYAVSIVWWAVIMTLTLSLRASGSCLLVGLSVSKLLTNLILCQTVVQCGYELFAVLSTAIYL